MHFKSAHLYFNVHFVHLSLSLSLSLYLSIYLSISLSIVQPTFLLHCVHGNKQNKESLSGSGYLVVRPLLAASIVHCAILLMDPVSHLKHSYFHPRGALVSGTYGGGHH